MTNYEVEILKIGSIVPIVPIWATTIKRTTDLYDTLPFAKPTIMVVCDGSPIFDYYVSMLKEHCDEYKFLNTAQNIVGKITTFRSSLIGNQPTDILKGISDGHPIVGKPYTLNNSGWHTSSIEKVIDDCIIITKNSVYAIHNLSKFREQKLNNIGI